MCQCLHALRSCCIDWLTSRGRCSTECIATREGSRTGRALGFPVSKGNVVHFIGTHAQATQGTQKYTRASSSAKIPGLVSSGPKIGSSELVLPLKFHNGQEGRVIDHRSQKVWHLVRETSVQNVAIRLHHTPLKCLYETLPVVQERLFVALFVLFDAVHPHPKQQPTKSVLGIYTWPGILDLRHSPHPRITPLKKAPPVVTQQDGSTKYLSTSCTAV